jgi:predicted peptidase
MKIFNKKLLSVISLILVVCLLVCGCNEKNADNTSSKTSTPTVSGPSVFNGNPNSSSKEEASSQSNTSSKNDKKEDKTNSTASVSDSDDQRVEKVIKTYKFEDEFFAPLYDKLTFKDSQTGRNMPYNLAIPKDYRKSKKYPVLLLLHGMGSQGTDFTSATSAFATIYRYSGDLLNQSIVIAPQTTEWWSVNEFGNDENGWLGSVMRLLKKIESQYSCDLDRVYVMGLSMGGYGTWEMLEYYGDHFAAGVPICGGGDPSFAKELAKIPIWIYHGEQDDTVSFSQSETMYDAIIAAGGKKIHFTRLPNVKHDSWSTAFKSRELLSWMYSQNKTKNKTSDYSIIPYFRIIDSNGKTIINDFDTSGMAQINLDGKDRLEFSLTDEGVKKLSKAYMSSGGKSFDVYYGNEKLLTFKATKKPIDDMFIIEDLFTASNYYWYFNRMNLIMNY